MNIRVSAGIKTLYRTWFAEKRRKKPVRYPFQITSCTEPDKTINLVCLLCPLRWALDLVYILFPGYAAGNGHCIRCFVPLWNISILSSVVNRKTFQEPKFMWCPIKCYISLSQDSAYLPLSIQVSLDMWYSWLKTVIKAVIFPLSRRFHLK